MRWLKTEYAILGVILEQTTYARALCEDFRHFLSEPSISEHRLCEDFPIILFGCSPTTVYTKDLSPHFEGNIRECKIEIILLSEK